MVLDVAHRETRRSTARVEGLWRNPDFVKLWAGQTVSMFGSQITGVALPLTAALYLDASPAQMGLLAAAGAVPFLLLGLPTGVWVDRRSRRPVLAADLGRAVLLGLIPVLYLVDALGMAQLISIALLVGVCSVLFELASPSYLPSLIDREDLTEGNGKLRTSASVSEIAGPGAAGVLVQSVTAPIALVVDALSFLASAAGLLAIRRPEPPPSPRGHDMNARRDVVEGLRATFGSKTLRAGACSAATYNFFWNAIEAVLALYAVRQLGKGAGIFGLTFTIGAAGALLGSLLAAPVARRVGPGPAIIGSAALSCTGLLLLAFVDDPATGAVLLVLAFFLRGVGPTGWNIHIASLQQSIVPIRLLGRMNASYLLLSLGAGSVGALLGGLLGGSIGLRPTLLIGTIGVALAWLWLPFSPLRRLRTLPDSDWGGSDAPRRRARGAAQEGGELLRRSWALPSRL